jgi:TM2 domain-containing membrane protein YozV
MMKKPVNQDMENNRRRNIALGAAFGLVIGGAADMLFGDTGWGLVIGVLLGAVIGYWVNFNLPTMEYPPYILRRVTLSGILFFAALLAAQWLLNREISSQYQILIALVPAVPGVLFVISIGSAISQLDELQRRIQLEAISIGFGAAVILFLTYALLVEVGFPEISWMFVPLILVFLWGVGKIWTIWKYR